MRLSILLLPIAATLMLAVPHRAAYAQHYPSPSGAHRVVTIRPGAPSPRGSTNMVRRAAIIDGVGRGVLAGGILGVAIGLLHARGDDIGGGLTFGLWTCSGMIAGAPVGGILAARRYDRESGPRLTWR